MTSNMITPRPYLSFSQMTLFEMSPEKYIQKYIYEEKERISRNIALGKQLADGLENGELSGDPLLDLVMAKIPKFELMDKPFETELKNGKEVIKILAKPDTMKPDMTAFKEYKTSTRAWTQKMADESGQITFYTTAIWLKTGRIPSDIELVCATTEYDENGALRPTGTIIRLRTIRHMSDIIKMTLRMRKAWEGIKKLCEKELL